MKEKDKILFLGATDSPLFYWLQEQGEDIIQTNEKISEAFVEKMAVTFIINYGYRYVLKKQLLDKFINRAINLHVSYLPWNRGTDPNIWSFVEGTPHGVTIHYLDEGLDTGDIICQKSVEFDLNKETLATSYAKLHLVIQDSFKQNWLKIKNGTCQRQKQIGQGSFHRIRDKKDINYLLTSGWNTPVLALMGKLVKRNLQDGKKNKIKKTDVKLAIMQPTFNSWFGYFELIDYVDKFIFLDTVQLNQQSWQTRNKIKVQDRELLVSIPIQKDKKSKRELLIKDTLIDYRKFDFRKKLLRTLEQSYKKSNYFDEVHEFISGLISYETKFLSEYNINTITNIVKKLGIDTELIILSETGYQKTHAKGNLVLDICQKYNIDGYISPAGSKEYMMSCKDSFIDNKIDIYYQNYEHPTYKQQGKEFITYLGVFDLLYNEGFTKSLDIIRSGSMYEIG